MNYIKFVIPLADPLIPTGSFGFTAEATLLIPRLSFRFRTSNELNWFMILSQGALRILLSSVSMDL